MERWQAPMADIKVETELPEAEVEAAMASVVRIHTAAMAAMAAKAAPAAAEITAALAVAEAAVEMEDTEERKMAKTAMAALAAREAKGVMVHMQSLEHPEAPAHPTRGDQEKVARVMALKITGLAAMVLRADRVIRMQNQGLRERLF